MTETGRVTVDPAPLLQYMVGTDPNPLQASTKGALYVNISNPDPSKPIRLFSIAISFSIGAAAVDLMTAIDGIRTPAPPGWTAKFYEGGVYRAKPDDTAGVEITTAGIALEILEISVNGQVGTTVIDIDESASDATHAILTRSTSATLGKFPARFRLSDLSVTPDPVVSGGSVVLGWLGSDMPGLVSYKLTWTSGGEPQSRAVTYSGPETISGVNTEPQTAFKLIASVAGAPDVTRPALVNVLPRAPVIDYFRGNVVGNQVFLEWSASYAEGCEIEGLSAPLPAKGERPFPIDRFRYTLTARNKNKTAKAAVDIKVKESASYQAADRWWESLGALPDGSLAIAMATLRELAVFDGVTMRQREAQPTRSFVGGVVTSASGHRTLLWGRSGPFAHLYDSAFNIIQHPDGDEILDAAFSPDGSWIYLLHTTGSGIRMRKHAAGDFTRVSEYNYDTGAPAKAGSVLAFSPRGDRLFVYSSNYPNGGTMLQIDPSNGTETRRAAFGGPAFFLNSMLCWQSGTKLVLSMTRSLPGTTALGTMLIDTDTFAVLRDLPWYPIALTAREVIGASYRGNQRHIEIADNTTFEVQQSIPTGRGYAGNFRAPIVRASRAIFVAHAVSGSITRYEGQSVEHVNLALLASHRTTRWHYQAMRSDSLLVVVATPPEGMRIDETELEIDVAGEGVTAEAPEGWSVTGAGERFTFRRTDDVEREILAFAFRNAGDGAIRVHETSRRTQELG